MTGLGLGGLLAALLAAAPGPRPGPSRAVAGVDPGVIGVAVDNGILAALPSFALSTEALSGPELASYLAEPVVQVFYSYIARCALPEGVTVSVPVGEDTLELAGGLGLAPEWADGPCDEQCQEWVSACLLALTNQYGVHVSLILGGTPQGNSGEAGAPIDTDQFVQEGGFYGNYFAPVPRLYACRGTGYDPLSMTFRRCSQPDALCGMAWVGPCGEVDGDTGLAATRRACGPEVDGVYRACSNRATVDGAYPEPHREYTRVITTYLFKTSFSPCPDTAPLEYDPSSAERPPPDAANTCDPATADALGCLGATCFNDDGCPDGLVCETGNPGLGMCTRECVDGAAADEAAACGGDGATCVEVGDGLAASTMCARACDPTLPIGAVGGCPDGRICTGFWWTHTELADDAACYPACRDDADCDATAYCHPRTLACAEGPPRPDGRADGEPCRMDKPDPCRGQCYRFTAGDDRGICGSLVDLRRVWTCPDYPGVMVPMQVSGDAVGLCIQRTCHSGLDCTPPLVCVAGSGGLFGTGSVCGYVP